MQPSVNVPETTSQILIERHRRVTADSRSLPTLIAAYAQEGAAESNHQEDFVGRRHRGIAISAAAAVAAALAAAPIAGAASAPTVKVKARNYGKVFKVVSCVNKGETDVNLTGKAPGLKLRLVGKNTSLAATSSASVANTAASTRLWTWEAIHAPSSAPVSTNRDQRFTISTFTAPRR